MLKKLYAEYISRTVNILTSCAFSNSRTQSIKNMESLKECHITSLSFRMLYCFILLVRGKKTEYLINCWLLHFHFLDMVSDFSRGLNFANGNFQIFSTDENFWHMSRGLHFKEKIEIHKINTREN